jgi:hypothetical protein
VDIEKKMREENFNIYLIAMVRLKALDIVPSLRNTDVSITTGETSRGQHQLDQPPGQVELQVCRCVLLQP